MSSFVSRMRVGSKNASARIPKAIIIKWLMMSLMDSMCIILRVDLEGFKCVYEHVHNAMV